MLASALLFAGMGVAVKIAGESLANAEVVFFRNSLGLLALTPWLVGRPATSLRTTALRHHLIRGLSGLMAMYCYFFAISRMRLAEAVLLNYAMPLFLPLVERLWLAEPIPRGLGSSLGVGFAGILLVLKPGASLFQPAALVGLLSAVFAAVAQVAIRRLTATEPIPRIVFYFGVIASLGSTLPLPWAWTTPAPRLWAVLMMMGVLATLGQLFLTAAYGEAPAGQVGPFVYSAVIFAALLDYAFWGKLPDPYSGLGAVLVIAASVLTLRRLSRSG